MWHGWSRGDDTDLYSFGHSADCKQMRSQAPSPLAWAVLNFEFASSLKQELSKGRCIQVV